MAFKTKDEIAARFQRNAKIVFLIKKHGGEFHGPNVETLSMPEVYFFRMIGDPEFQALFQKERGPATMPSEFLNNDDGKPL